MTLRIGILGAARVATYAMIGAARDVADVVVRGVAARDPARAADYAAEHGIARVYPDYQALIEADDIDAVYVALPPHLHARWSIAALMAGKPVLCEKPFSLTPADAAAMVAAEAAHGGLLMEAQHSHYHPLSAHMRELVQSGALGEIVKVEAEFCAPVARRPGEIRYDRAVGGGALWDLGVYPAYWATSALGEALTAESAVQHHCDGDPAAADIASTAVLRSASGAEVRLHCAMDEPLAATIRFTGTRGWLSIRNPLAPHMGHECRWDIGSGEQTQQFAAPSTYALQLAAFRSAVRDGAPVPTRGSASSAGVRLLAAIDDLARSGANHAD
jgi:predicted dehydrogenase